MRPLEVKADSEVQDGTKGCKIIICNRALPLTEPVGTDPVTDNYFAAVQDKPECTKYLTSTAFSEKRILICNGFLGRPQLSANVRLQTSILSPDYYKAYYMYCQRHSPRNRIRHIYRIRRMMLRNLKYGSYPYKTQSAGSDK